MSHRAIEIVDAAAAALAASATLRAVVFTHRQLTMSADEQEVPAVSVRMGSDTPISDAGVENFTYIDSLLEISVEAYARDVDEVALLTQLVELRRQIHITLQADITLGLPYVSDVRYGGALEPALSADAEFMAGSLSSRWLVRYRMNQADPG